MHAKKKEYKLSLFVAVGDVIADVQGCFGLVKKLRPCDIVNFKWST